MASKLAKEIALGRHDEDLPEIVEAVGLRAVERRVEVRWRLTFGDIVIDEDSITVGELCRVEEMTGKTWVVLNPRRSAGAAKAFLQAALEHREDLSAADASARVDAMSASDLAGALTEYVIDDAPFEQAPES